jgi:uncharacterized cupredoxin-like copper-binding protein
MNRTGEVSEMRKPTARSAAALALVVAAFLAAAPPLHAARAERGQQAATMINVKGGEFFFKLSSKSIARPERVTFVFKNVGHVVHDLKINGKATPLIQSGQTAKLVVVFKKKGTYAYSCTVPGHATAGMKGIFIVR